MPHRNETQRQKILRVLATQQDWMTRAKLIQAVGSEKGYAAIIGAADGAPATGTLRHKGWVEAKRASGKVSYRLTATGRKAIMDTPVDVQDGADPNTWQKVVEALEHLGGRASVTKIHLWLVAEHGSFDADTLKKALISISVNDETRFAYRAWRKRHGALDSPNLDRVFLIRTAGMDDVYEAYDPAKHGLWRPYMKKQGGLGLRRLDETMEQAVEAASAAEGTEFDPKDETEGKKYLTRSIAVRRGQQKFRSALLKAYGSECCISGCKVEQILEAAHIYPYEGTSTNLPSNGLLLRSDLHMLFDLGLIRIDSASLAVQVHEDARDDPAYGKFHGLVIKQVVPEPSKKSLKHHWQRHESQWSTP